MGRLELTGITLFAISLITLNVYESEHLGSEHSERTVSSLINSSEKFSEIINSDREAYTFTGDTYFKSN